jgi:hypothetical protein
LEESNLLDYSVTGFLVLSKELMLQHIIHEQLLEAEKELQTLQKEILQLRARTLLYIQLVFEICGHEDSKDKSFDWKGDNDILEINFAGTHVDIRRCMLTNSVFGMNFFSSLFQKKWDEFHVRDKSGRIYLDFQEEWLKPLIDYLEEMRRIAGTTVSSWFSLETFGAKSFIAHPNYFLLHIMRYFQMDKLFNLASDKTTLRLEGIDNYQITESRLESFLCEKYLSVMDSSCRELDCKLIYSHSSEGELRPSPDYDIRFKLFIYVVHVGAQVNTGYIRHDSISMKREFADLFPIIWHVNNKSQPPLYSGNLSVYKKLEIYEVKSNYDIPVYEISYRERKIKDSDESNQSAVEKLVDSIKTHDRKLRKEKTDLEAEITFLQTELWFMTLYFHRTWNFPQDSTKGSPQSWLKLIVEKKRALYDNVQNEKGSELNRELQLLYPMVYFNVEGEILSILRSTVLRAIPKSQFAVRVSGRWEEQAEKGDIDEEGNLIVNYHKESFRQILAALQVFYPSNKLRIFVTALCRDFIVETLNYLLIVPDFLVYID